MNNVCKILLFKKHLSKKKFQRDDQRETQEKGKYELICDLIDFLKRSDQLFKFSSNLKKKKIKF